MKKGYSRDISKLKKLAVVCLIIILDVIAFAVSFEIVNPVFNVQTGNDNLHIFNYCACILLPVFFLFIFGAYKFKNLKNFFRLIYLSAFSLVISFVLNIFLDLLLFGYRPLRYLFYFFLSSFVSAISLRLIYYFSYHLIVRYFRKSDDYWPTIIIGAGFTGKMVYNELYHYNSKLVPICFVDDDEDKIGSVIESLRVLGPTVIIPEIVKKYDVKSIVFAIPSCKDEDKKRILKYCAETDCEISVIPSGNQIVNKKTLLTQISKIDIEKLIGRDEIVLDNNKQFELLKDKVCLVTGAGGSIGSELSRQIAASEASKIVLLDINENSTFDLQQELIISGVDSSRLQVEIASIRDYDKLEELFKKYSFNFVFHAAAHKHVPLMENSPEEAVKNNCLGTYNLALLADKYNVSEMIFISTDKAGSPDNIMAASKRVSEVFLKYFAKTSSCIFKSVRFGNVLGSNGSVIQLFLKQIEKGGPLTVTHPEIVRYFMTIPECVSLIIKTLSIESSNNIYILDMGKPIKILTLAENLIAMCGYEPYIDIDIKFCGLRPGESLSEKACIKEEFIKTDVDKIYQVNNIDFDSDKFMHEFSDLLKSANENNTDLVVKRLYNLI